MGNVKYGILHCHSEYSLNDSAMSADMLVKTAHDMGCGSITLTDHGTVLGIESFMDAGKKYGVNTIPGVEAYTEGHAHLIICARNYEGYLSIIHAMRDANLRLEDKNGNVIKKLKDSEKNMRLYPVMTDAVLEKHFKGNSNVFATSACVAGQLGGVWMKAWKAARKSEKERKKAEDKIHGFEEQKIQLKKDRDRYEEILSIIKEKKKEKKQHEGFTKEPYKKQIEDLRNSAELIPDLMQEVYRMEETRESAIEACDSIDNEIADLENEKARLKKASDAYKSLVKKIKEHKTEKAGADTGTDFLSEDDLYRASKERLMYLVSVFPRFYVELQYHGIDEEAWIMPNLARLAKAAGIPVIAANDAHMARRDDLAAREVVRFGFFARHTESSAADRELYLKTDEELSMALRQILDPDTVNEAMENLSVLSECHVQFPEAKHYPKIKNGPSFDELLEKKKQELILAGEWDEEHEKRLAYEIGVIKKMGYTDYHLVVRDYCIFGRKIGVVPKSEVENIPDDESEIDGWIQSKGFRTGIGIGPGRGSAVGSLVCYMLGITNVDPLKYGLLFERYLNPDRISMPDIDTDYKTSIRQQGIAHIKRMYGAEAVASIVTEGRRGPKKAVQDAGRDLADSLYGKGGKEPDEDKKQRFSAIARDMASKIPDDAKTLDSCMEQLDAFVQEHPEMRLVVNNALLIENTLFSTGIHAGGVVISDTGDINDCLPLAYSPVKQTMVIQCDMVRTEEKGYLKMDVLGLGTLDDISDALQLIEKYHGVVIDPYHIPFEEDVFKEIFAKGFTNSVFQFESSGMKQMLRDFQPGCIEDIILLAAAYRPGPMQYLPDIIARKKGEKPMEYLVPQLEPILNTTYCGIIYQEQVMMICQKLAGYSFAQADLVRRAMSKKKEEKLKKERTAFVYGDKERNITGCVNNGIPEDRANLLFDQMMDFARYAFNKSHATAYAIVAYMTAYLKYHYPVEFFCARFNNIDKQADFRPLFDDMSQLGIKLLPPDINRSMYEFMPEGGNIRFGYKGMSGISESKTAAIDRICSVRKETGVPYMSLFDFLKRTSDKETGEFLDTALTDAIINSGGFDDSCKDRRYLSETFQNFVDKKARIRSYKELCKKLDSADDGHELPADRTYNAHMEMEYLGSVISQDPLNDYQSDEAYGCVPVCELGNIKNAVRGQHQKEKTLIFGYIAAADEKTSKKKNRLIVFDIVGKRGKVTAMASGMAYERLKGVYKSYIGRVVRLSGDYGENIFFIRNVELLAPEVMTYTIVIDTEEKYRMITEMLKNSGSGSNRLIIKSAFGRRGRMPFPKVCRAVYVNDDFINTVNPKRA